MVRMLSNLRKVWAILLLGGLLLLTLGTQEFSLLSAASQGIKENPCPLCGQPWRGRVDLEMAIPEKLPTPKNKLWISNLRRVLMMEKLAKAQYETDQRRFGITNPYLYVIPQLNQHVTWINRLFSAYGLLANGEIPPIKHSNTVLQALKNGKKMETELVTQCEWLLKHAEDNITKRVVNTIFTQTSVHEIMFNNDIHIIEIEGSIAPLLF